MVRRRSSLNQFLYNNVFKYKLTLKIFKKKFKFLKYILLIRRKKLFLRKRQFHLVIYFNLMLNWSIGYNNYLKSLRFFIFFTNTYVFYLYVNLLSNFYNKFIHINNIVYYSIFFKINFLMVKKSINKKFNFIKLYHFSQNFVFASKATHCNLLSLNNTKLIINSLNNFFFFNSYVLIINYNFLFLNYNISFFHELYYFLLYSLGNFNKLNSLIQSY
jgi:hypothetical protein